MGDVEQQLRECKKQIDALPRAISTEPCSFVNTILSQAVSYTLSTIRRYEV